MDWQILYLIQEHMRCGVMDELMRGVTFLGNRGIVWIVVTAFLLMRRAYRKAGLVMAAGLIVGTVMGEYAFKPLIARPRPCWLDSSIQLLVPFPGDYLFPSCHALSSAVCATVLTAQNRRWGRIAIPLAAAISFSRVYLFVHFPSDVLAGAALGVILGVGMLALAKALAGCETFPSDAGTPGGGAGAP